MAEESAERTQEEPIERLPAEVRAQMLQGEESLFYNVALFEHAQRVAEMFAKSTMVPQQFQNNIGNCMIGLNYASRIKADPFMAMQLMHVIKGKPGIEGKLVAALINQSAKYREPLSYEWLDAENKPIEDFKVYGDSTKDGRGCRAVTIETATGTTVKGPKISWDVVHDEGWYNKDGSKWKTIPELMFMYRSASWFSNVHCPEVKLGMHTTEEIQEMVELVPGADGVHRVAEKTKGKLETLKKRVGESTTPPDDESTPLYDEAKNLRKSGFKPWVSKNADRIAEGSEADNKKLKDKWDHLYPEEAWPIEEKAEASTEGDPGPQPPEDGGSAGEATEATPGDDKSDPVRDLYQELDKDDEPTVERWINLGLATCPNLGDKNIPATRCRKCEQRLLDGTLCPGLVDVFKRELGSK